MSTAGGAISIRTTQLGFAAELTSGWSATTGYSFKRRKLDTAASPIALVNPGVQPTGDRAYEVGGNTSLTAGTNVWMEPSPDGTGYLFASGIASDAAPDCSALSYLDWTDCLLFTTANPTGRCAAVTAGQLVNGFSSGAGRPWIGNDTLTTDTGTWTPAYYPASESYPQGRLSLTYSGSGSGSGTVYGIPQGCRTVAGIAYAVFSFGGTNLCGGTAASCGANSFEVWVRCGGSGCTVAICSRSAVSRRMCLTLKDAAGPSGWDTAGVIDLNCVATQAEGDPRYTGPVYPSGGGVVYAYIEVNCTDPDTWTLSIYYDTIYAPADPDCPAPGAVLLFTGTLTVSSESPFTLAGTVTGTPFGDPSTTLNVTLSADTVACDSGDCTACSLVGGTPTLVIPAGRTNAGTYGMSAWVDNGFGDIYAQVTVGGVVYTAQCLANSNLILTATDSGTNYTETGSVDCGPPVVMSFDPPSTGPFTGTGTYTVTT